MRTCGLVPKITLALWAVAGIQPTSLLGQESPESVLKVLANRPAVATIAADLEAGGDVHFLFSTVGERTSFDFPAAARKLWGCDWQPREAYGEEVAGTCHHMLRTVDGLVDDYWLFAPMVLALRGSGYERVSVQLGFPRRPALTVRTTEAWDRTEGFSDNSYSFYSNSFAALPPPIEIRRTVPPAMAWLAIPLALMLLIPAVVALALRQIDQQGRTSRGLLWMNWIGVASALFWLLVLPPGRIVPLLLWLPQHTLYLQLVAGTLMFCVPPLLATGIALLILRTRLIPEPEARSVGQVLRRHLLAEAGLLLIFGLPVIGVALDSQSWSSVFLGFGVGLPFGVALLLLARRRKGGGVKVLESGRLRDRVTEFAQSTGVRIKRVSILWNWHRSEANAAAWLPGRQILITDSLLTLLTKRETDAVLAHEVGHFRDRPWPLPPKLCCTFAVVYMACHLFLSGDSVWAERMLAFVAFGLLLFSARVMRNREFRADQWSAHLTQDPMAMVSSLGQIARVRPLPLDWGTIGGSILSHPSCRARALALARYCRVPEAQALAILENPEDSANTPNTSERYDLATECASANMEFSLAKKAMHLGRSAIAFPALLVFLVFALASALNFLLKPIGVLAPGAAFLLGLPLVLWLAIRTLAASRWHFLKATVLAVQGRLPKRFEGELVALLPGDDLIPIEGFFASDFGKFGASGDRLVYFGENTNFSVPRQAIKSIDVISKRVHLRLRYGVRIRTQGGSFIVTEVTRLTSRRGAARLERRWLQWWMGEAEATPASHPPFEFPPLELPVRTTEPTPHSPVKPVVGFMVLQLVAGGLISSMLPESSLSNLAILAGPFLYFLTMAPALIEWKRMPRLSAGARLPVVTTPPMTPTPTATPAPAGTADLS